MPALRMRNKLGVFKTESNEGVEASGIAPSSNAFSATSIDVGVNPNVIEDNELRGGLGAGDIVVGATPMSVGITANLRGVGTAGTALEWGDILESAGMLETVNSTPNPASGTTTCSGGTTSSVTFTVGATNWPTTAGALVGQMVELGGDVDPAVVTQVTSYAHSAGTITLGFSDVLGSAASSSTTIKKLPNVLYAPHSGAIPSGSFWGYVDGTIWKIYGCRGDAAFDLTAGGKGALSSRLNGVYNSRGDISMPTSTNLDSITTQPPIWVNGKMLINGVAAAASRFTLALNNGGTFPGNPNAAQGLDPYVVTGRSVQGSINPLMTLVATRDLFADLRGQTVRRINVLLGPKTAGANVGNRIAFQVLNAKFRGYAMSDDQGVGREDVPFQCQGVNNEVYVCVF